MIGSLDLQKAIYDRLVSDAALVALLGGPRVFDVAPARARLPYIAFGPIIASDWSTSDDNGSAVIFTINCWSHRRGRKNAARIAERISALLEDGVTFPITDDTHCVLLHPLGTRIENDLQARAIHSTLRFRALIEKSTSSN